MRWIIMASLFFLLTGCSNLNKEKYDKLQIGMSYSSVIDILGKATQCEALAGMSDCTWGDEKRYIKIKFITDKVMFMHSSGLE